MTQTTERPRPLLPPGAASADDWVEAATDRPSRTVYGERFEIDTYVAGAWATQESDGSTSGHDVYVEEMQDGYQCERINLSAEDARRLAEALLAAADTADGWVIPHPVDSATRKCCGGVGTHTQVCAQVTR